MIIASVSENRDIEKRISITPEISKKYINNQNVCLMLGDNFFFGQGFYQILKKGTNLKKGAFFLGYNVQDPKKYAVLETKGNKIISIMEKPEKPKTNLAVPGIYFFDKKVVELSKKLKPSKRGELEITELLKKYQNTNQLSAEFIGRGGAWLDTGSIEDFHKTSIFVEAIENRQGLKIACLEEIAYLNKWISKKNIIDQIKFYGNCEYSNYLKKVIKRQ